MFENLSDILNNAVRECAIVQECEIYCADIEVLKVCFLSRRVGNGVGMITPNPGINKYMFAY